MNVVARDMANNPIPRDEWERIKALGPSGPRYVHVSARIGHFQGPDGFMHSFVYKRDRRVPLTNPAMCGDTYRRTGRRGA